MTRRTIARNIQRYTDFIGMEPHSYRVFGHLVWGKRGDGTTFAYHPAVGQAALRKYARSNQRATTQAANT